MKSSAVIKTTAQSIKSVSLLTKGVSVVLSSVIVLVSATYVVSYFYDRFASFSVSVQQYDMINQGLSLSATPEFENPISRLNAGALKECTNISGDTIPLNIDMINGEHNGADYIAYTFYIKNVGVDTVTYEYKVNLANVTNGIDEAIRIRVYKNGEYINYAKTRSDGGGNEQDTTSFKTLATAVDEKTQNFSSGDIDKYTIVIWLEGDDPDCVDSIIGGRFKAEMNFSIVEG